MPMTEAQAAEAAAELLTIRADDMQYLDTARRYLIGRQKLPQVIPDGAPHEVFEMARMARVNIVDIVVESLAQSLFAEGFRIPRKADNLDVWKGWQANRLDARQSGIHRAALTYGRAYAVVWPAKDSETLEGAPRVRGVSPRQMTTQYSIDSDDWPVRALEKLGSEWRLYDAEAMYRLRRGSDDSDTDQSFQVFDIIDHPFKVAPVVRYVDEWDLDASNEVADERQARVGAHRPQLVAGQVGKLQPLQDQVDFTTFNLLVAMHYAAFKQRWIIGWTAQSETENLKAASSKLWTFEDNPEDVKVGEFGQTDLKGYIDSREASLRHAATLSQTPVHELIGQMVNLSAEALAAAEAGRDRKVADRKTLFGESHEQTLWLMGQVMGVKVPMDAQMVWRDTSARSFGSVVDALGKLKQMLEIPAEELWEWIPGASLIDVERWRKMAAEVRAALPDTPPADRPQLVLP